MIDKNEAKHSNGGISTGDITGAGIIVGKEIHIEGDFIVQTSKEALSLGLTLLSPKYFQTRGIEGDFEKWKDGFGFELPDIMAGLEFKRKSVSDIIKKLDEKAKNVGGHSVLLLGKSGSSKSTILMELICHYFKEQYIVLHNLRQTKIEDVDHIVKFIEDRLEQGKVKGKENKILVAVDDVHNERTAAIFAVIDQLNNHIKKDNLRFVISARQPEFDRFVEDRLGSIPSQISDSIEKLVKTRGIKFEVQPFDEPEIQDFVRKYSDVPEIVYSIGRLGFQESDLDNYEKLKELASEIYEQTNGDPILVKFLLIGKGLLHDVKKRYKEHLATNEDKLITSLICSILNRTGISVTRTLTDCMNITNALEELTGYTISFLEDTNTWKTIHPAWDLAFLTYLFTSSNDIAIVNKRKRLMRKGISSLFSCLPNEEDKYFVLGTLYDSTSVEIEEKMKLPINILEEVITSPNNFINVLDNDYKVDLYTYYIGNSYYELERYDDAIRNYDKAIELSPKNPEPLYDKALALSKLGQQDEAIKFFNKAWKYGGKPSALYNKGLALSKLGQQDEAIKFFNKALEYDPSMSMVVLIDLSVILENLGRYKEVIDVYKRLQDIHWPISYRFKDKEGYAHYKMGDLEKAIEIVDDTLALNPHFANALYNKSVYLSRKGEIEDSISYLKKAIELDKTYMDKAKTDKDLDPIRKDARFIKLVSTVE